MLFNIQKYAHTVCCSNANKWIRVCSSGVWSKSSISQKIVPRNRISKSLEAKQFINVRSGANVVGGTIAWSKLMQLGVRLALICHFLVRRFHTLKIELDFFSRQGHWQLYRTGVYHGILLKEKQRRSCCFFCSQLRYFRCCTSEK